MKPIVRDRNIYNVLTKEGEINWVDLKYKIKYIYRNEKLMHNSYIRFIEDGLTIFTEDCLTIIRANKVTDIKLDFNCIPHNFSFMYGIFNQQVVDDELIVMGKSTMEYQTVIVIYNLKTNTMKYGTLYGYVSFTISPNGKNVLMFNLNNMVSVLPFDVFCKLHVNEWNWKQLSFTIYEWKNDDEIIALRYNELQLLDKITFFDTNLIPEKNLNMIGYQISSVTSHKYVYNDHFIICYSKILIIDSQYRRIQINSKDIIGYCSKYDVYINDRHKLFKTNDVEMIEYVPKYDFWNNTDIPSIVEDIIDVIVFLGWFPPDVIGQLYLNILGFRQRHDVHFNLNKKNTRLQNHLFCKYNENDMD